MDVKQKIEALARLTHEIERIAFHIDKRGFDGSPFIGAAKNSDWNIQIGKLDEPTKSAMFALFKCWCERELESKRAEAIAICEQLRSEVGR